MNYVETLSQMREIENREITLCQQQVRILSEEERQQREEGYEGFAEATARKVARHKNRQEVALARVEALTEAISKLSEGAQ